MRALGKQFLVVAAAVAVCVAQVVGASVPQAMSSSSSEPSGSGVLASVRIEFRAPGLAVVSIAPGLFASSEPAERETVVAAWPSEMGRLLVTYDAESDRLEAVLENEAGSTAITHHGAVTRGFGKLDPFRFSPIVAGLVAEAANRGAAGAIALRSAELGTGRRPRRVQDIGAGTQAVSQLLHANRAMAGGFTLAGTIYLTDARPATSSPLSIEIRLLAESAATAEADPQSDAVESSGATFINSTPTTIPNLGIATPYPSQIVVDPGYYLTGVVTSAVVGFDNLDHTYPGEIGALLVGPAGHSVMLMRWACAEFDLLDVDFTFDDAALMEMPWAPCFSGSWRPTGDGYMNAFPPPAPPPAPAYGATLSVFVGDSPIGTWSLYLNIYQDIDFPDFGRIDAWSLTLTTAIQIPSTGTFGNAAPYPSTYTFSGVDPNQGLKNCSVNIEDFTHTYPGDLHLLLTAPSGQTAYLVGDVCGEPDAENLDWVLDDFAAGFIPGSSCPGGTFRPTALGTEAFSAPAPAGPYGRSLAALSGSGFNGVFALYALDDASGDSGRIRDWGFSCSAQDFWLFADGFETSDLLRWSADAP